MNLGGTIRLNRTGFCIVLAMLILLILYITSNKGNNSKLDENNQEISMKHLLYTAIETAKRGGMEIKNFKGNLNIKSKGKTAEGLSNSVTNADLNSHCAMYLTLKQTFPHIHIVSEEEHDCTITKDLKIDASLGNTFSNVPDSIVPVKDITIWIDPLDATKEYTENLLQYVTTMVCVAVNGRPVIGVIHKPFLEKTSWAWNKNKNVFSHDLHVPKDQGTDHPKIIISLAHAGEVEKTLKEALGNSVTIIKAAGAGYKVLEVVAGNATAYYHTTSINKWDTCAGNAILNALSGKMTTSFNEEIDYSHKTGVMKTVIDKGLLGTIYSHDWFIQKLTKKTQ